MRLMPLSLLFLTIWAGSLPCRAQCVPLFTDTPLISDRYIDSVEFGDRLILANAHGLIVKDLSTSDLITKKVIPVAGEVSQLSLVGTRLFVTAQGSGLYVYEIEAGEDSIKQITYYPIPGLQTVVVTDQAIFANNGSEVIFFKEDGFGEIEQTDSISAAPRKIEASASLLFIHGHESDIKIVPYGNDGFAPAKNLVIDGNSVFYDLDYANGIMVLDALNGVKWLEFSQDGNVLAQGFLHKNSDPPGLVLASNFNGDTLAIRFSERMDVFRFDASKRLTLIDTLDLPFLGIGTLRVRLSKDNLNLLNIDPRGRDWSLTTYRIQDDRLVFRARLSAVFEDLLGAGSVGDHIYLATRKNVFMARDAEDLRNFNNLTVVREFDGAIQEILASDNYLFLLVSVPNTSQSKLYAFSPGADGELDEKFTREYDGALRNLTQYRDRVAFLQYFRNSSGDNYVVQLVLADGNTIRTRNFTRLVSPGQTNPFLDLQISELGLSYHNGESVTIHPDPEDTITRTQYPLPLSEKASKVVSFASHFWAETAGGLSLLKLGEAVVTKTGYYPHWYNLDILPNGQVLVQSRMDRVPSHFHLVGLDENERAFANLTFATSTRPVLISLLENDVFLAERTALSFYRFHCPLQDTVYLLPFSSEFELEVSTIIDEKDIITMNIYNENNQIIGTQKLNSDLVESLNGSNLSGWMFDFNSLETPHAIALVSTKPLAPIISGQAGPDKRSRFAYRVPPLSTSNLYVPHVPQNLSSWSTDLYLRSFDGQAKAFYEIQGSSGAMISKETNTGSTEIIPLREGTLQGPNRWMLITTNELDTFLSGFTLFQLNALGQAAAVPLVSELTDFFFVPYLAGTHEEDAWSGLVLANPHPDAVDVRVVGYGMDGEIAIDRIFEVEASSSFVTVAESWLEDLQDGERIQWCTLFPNRPIMGMLLYGNHKMPKLAGLPLSSKCGKTLLYPGIRENARWTTHLAVTNIEPNPAGITIVAYNGYGEIVATAEHTLRAKESTSFSVKELFSNLNEREKEKIQTVLIRTDQNITGFLKRSMTDTHSLEAVSALILSE